MEVKYKRGGCCPKSSKTLKNIKNIPRTCTMLEEAE
jgi:hypothetical protein